MRLVFFLFILLFSTNSFADSHDNNFFITCEGNVVSKGPGYQNTESFMDEYQFLTINKKIIAISRTNSSSPAARMRDYSFVDTGGEIGTLNQSENSISMQMENYDADKAHVLITRTTISFRTGSIFSDSIVEMNGGQYSFNFTGKCTGLNEFNDFIDNFVFKDQESVSEKKKKKSSGAKGFLKKLLGNN